MREVGLNSTCEEVGLSPTEMQVGKNPTYGEVGLSLTYGLERARSFQPGPGGLPMGRLWRASTVGGVRPPLAPGCKHPASVMPRHHRVPAPRLPAREGKQGAPSCGASMHQHGG